MRRATTIRLFSAFLAVGLLLQPLASTQAQGNSQITDVELKADNSFQGKPVDARGQVQPDTSVTVQNVQTGQTIRTTTAADGTFAVQNLQPGVYDITVGRMTSTVRVWPHQTGPAGAVQQVSYQPPAEQLPPVVDATGGGGAFSGANGLLVGGAILGVTAGIIIAITAS